MSKVFISGSHGFIGSHLFKRLETANSLNVKGIVHGTLDNCDKIFFLSTYGNMAHHHAHNVMVQANVQDVITVRDWFNGWLCYMSSSSVTLPVQTPYSRTKRAAEEILQALPELKSCIVRPYSVVGVNEQREHLIPTLIRSCMEGEGMMFDPSPTHDFVDVIDVVDGLIRLENDKVCGVFEFGNRIAISNEEVRRMVEEITGRKANITKVAPMRVYDNEDWCCKTTNDYWQPTKSLRQSISEMVEQYRHEHA